MLIKTRAGIRRNNFSETTPNSGYSSSHFLYPGIMKIASVMGDSDTLPEVLPRTVTRMDIMDCIFRTLKELHAKSDYCAAILLSSSDISHVRVSD
jgi:hypothetical protein